MRKFEAFLTPRKFDYSADETSDGIVYAVKYEMDLTDNVEAKFCLIRQRRSGLTAKQ
ncbi:MAG: hypothetical protein ACLUSP_03215 [Christensenellales bacterium]